MAHFAYASRIARSAFAVVVRPFRLLGGTLRPLGDFLAFFLAPFAAGFASLSAFVTDMLQPVWLAVQTLLLAPLRVLSALWSALGPLLAAAWETARAAAAAFSAFWRSFAGLFDGVVRPLLSAAKATHAAGGAVSSPGRSLLFHAKTLWDEIFSGLWRGTRAILMFSSHLCVSLNKHRLSISIAARARWDRTAGKWLRWLAASVSGLRGAANQVSMVPCPLATEGTADSPHAADSPRSGGSPSPRRGWRVDSGLSVASQATSALLPEDGEQQEVWTDDLGGPAAPLASTRAAGAGFGSFSRSPRSSSPTGSASGSPPAPAPRIGSLAAGKGCANGSGSALGMLGGWGSSGALVEHGGGGGGAPAATPSGPKSFWASLAAAVGSAAHWADAEVEDGGHWAEPPREQASAAAPSAAAAAAAEPASTSAETADGGSFQDGTASAVALPLPPAEEEEGPLGASAASLIRFSQGCAGGSPPSSSGDAGGSQQQHSGSPAAGVHSAAVPRRPRTGSAANLKQRRTARRRDVGTTTSGDDPPVPGGCRAAFASAGGAADSPAQQAGAPATAGAAAVH